MKLIFVISLLIVQGLQADDSAAAETLAKAARAGDLKTIETLLSAGVSPDLPDQYGRAPISYAASFNRTKVVELLLAYHADPNPRDHSSKYAHQLPATPLQSAAQLGNRRIASLLLEAGARVNEKERRAGRPCIAPTISWTLASCSSITART